MWLIASTEENQKEYNYFFVLKTFLQVRNRAQYKMMEFNSLLRQMVCTKKFRVANATTVKLLLQ